MDLNYIEILPEELIVNISEYLQSDIKLLKSAYLNNYFINKIIDGLLSNIMDGNIDPSILFNSVKIDYDILEELISTIDEIRITGDIIIKITSKDHKEVKYYDLLKNKNQTGYFYQRAEFLNLSI